MELLQVINTDLAQSQLTQYGVLGLFVLILGYFAWMQYQRLASKNDLLEQKVDRLQEEMMQILVEERDRLARLITENTQALSELQKTILQYMVKNNE